jgi:rSAM/selenodomain-associated transferase 1
MTRAERRLLVFAKAPVRGRVKTRLAAELGRTGARRAYLELLSRTLATAANADVAPIELWCAPGRHPTLRRLAGEHGAALRVQPPGDLGQRMARALRASLRQARQAVIIGGDCAALTGNHLEAAFGHLAGGAEWVFAPAEDGGYALVGARCSAMLPFQAMPWGGGRVMRLTRQRLRRLGVRWVELDTTWDIDRPADWHRWRRFGRPGHGHYACASAAWRRGPRS